MSRERFATLMTEAITSIPQDLKSALRVLDDPDLDDDSRVLIAGAILHTFSSNNVIPGVRGALQQIGDVLVMRLVMERVEKSVPETIARHREESPEFLAPLNEQLESAREFLGDRISVLEDAVNGLPKLSHQGHAARQCALDPDGANWLYDAVHEAIIELEIDDEEVDRELRGVDKILAPLSARIKK